jgi:hypothetical protein
MAPAHVELAVLRSIVEDFLDFEKDAVYPSDMGQLVVSKYNAVEYCRLVQDLRNAIQ